MFLKKLWLGAFWGLVALVLLTANSPANDPPDQNPPHKNPLDITVADLNQEGPLTPKDIDIYIKYVALSKDLIALAEKDPRYSVEGEWAQVIEDEWVKFAQDNNLTTIRLYYLLEKIQVNLGLTEPEQPSAGDAPYLKLSAAEKRLLADNKSRILAAFKDLWP